MCYLLKIDCVLTNFAEVLSTEDKPPIKVCDNYISTFQTVQGKIRIKEFLQQTSHS